MSTDPAALQAVRDRIVRLTVELAEAKAELAAMLGAVMAEAEAEREGLVGKRRLRSVERRSTVGNKVETLTDTHKLNISAASKGGSDPFLKHIRAKGYTLRSLAKKLPGDHEGHLSASMLSMNRRTHGIPQARADLIAKLTGWPADRKHWPAGILS